jgi:hypothetical protein
VERSVFDDNDNSAGIISNHISAGATDRADPVRNRAVLKQAGTFTQHASPPSLRRRQAPIILGYQPPHDGVRWLHSSRALASSHIFVAIVSKNPQFNQPIFRFKFEPQGKGIQSQIRKLRVDTLLKKGYLEDVIIYIAFQNSYLEFDHKWNHLWQVTSSMHELCQYLVDLKRGCIRVRLLSIPKKKRFGLLQVGSNGEIRYMWGQGSARLDLESP